MSESGVYWKCYHCNQENPIKNEVCSLCGFRTRPKYATLLIGNIDALSDE